MILATDDVKSCPINFVASIGVGEDYFEVVCEKTGSSATLENITFTIFFILLHFLPPHHDARQLDLVVAVRTAGE